MKNEILWGSGMCGKSHLWERQILKWWNQMLTDIENVEYVVTKQEFIVNLVHPEDKSDTAWRRDARYVDRESGFYVEKNALDPQAPQVLGKKYSLEYEHESKDGFWVQKEKDIILPLNPRNYFNRLQWFIWQWMVVLPTEPDNIRNAANASTGYWSPCEININTGAVIDCSNPYRLVDKETYDAESAIINA